MEKNSRIVLEGYHILLKFSNPEKTTINRIVGTHEDDGCSGKVYVHKDKEGLRVTCENWSVIGCHLDHTPDRKADISTFAKLIAYAKKLA